jgi:hypothetical protein
MKELKKLYWQVLPVLTDKWKGRYRGWPEAYYDKEKEYIAACIFCESSYVPQKVKVGDHTPLTVSIMDYSARKKNPEGPGWVRLRILKTFPNLKEAQKAALEVLSLHPNLWPTAIREKVGKGER